MTLKIENIVHNRRGTGSDPVEACGVCHTHSLTVEGQFPGLRFPRVPGHEVTGRMEAVGSGVSQWRFGQRVGVDNGVLLLVDTGGPWFLIGR